MLKFDAVIEHILGKFEQDILSDCQVQAFLQRVQQDRSFHKQNFEQKQSIIFVYEHNLPSPYLLCMSMNFRYFMHALCTPSFIVPTTEQNFIAFQEGSRKFLPLSKNFKFLMQWPPDCLVVGVMGSTQQWWFDSASARKQEKDSFKKMGRPRPLFHFFIFVFSKTYYNFYSK